MDDYLSLPRGCLDDLKVLLDEYGVRLNVPASWISRRTRLGQQAIPHVRIGKYVRFDWTQVIHFFEDRTERQADQSASCQ